jgi:ribosomal protein S6
MHAGGVVRKIESWGTQQLPQRMKKKRTSAYEQIGECVPHPINTFYRIHLFVPATGHFIVTPALKPSVP